MEGRVLIPRTKGGRKSFTEPSPAWGRDANGEVFIRCKCGLCMGIQHDVAENGDVMPSLFHDADQCGWHVWGTFADWDGGRVAA